MEIDRMKDEPGVILRGPGWVLRRLRLGPLMRQPPGRGRLVWLLAGEGRMWIGQEPTALAVGGVAAVSNERAHALEGAGWALALGTGVAAGGEPRGGLRTQPGRQRLLQNEAVVCWWAVAGGWLGPWLARHGFRHRGALVAIDPLVLGDGSKLERGDAALCEPGEQLRIRGRGRCVLLEATRTARDEPVRRSVARGFSPWSR